MKATVVICTYNRASSLSRTLQSLADQAGESFNCLDVLIVDNNCNDDTEAVARRFVEVLPIRYCREPTQGLSHARNRAISDAKGGTLIFTDDDVVLDRGWLAAYLRAIDEYPAAGYFGGRIRPDWTECPRPSWLKNEGMPLLSGVLVCHDLGEATRPYAAADDTPFGASFAVRRAVLTQLREFRTDLGVRGSTRGRGEETELLWRARARGVAGIYVGEALCWHRVDRGRLSLPSLYRYGVESGLAHKKFANKEARGSILKAAGFIMRGLRQLALDRGDRFRQCVINAGIQAGLRQ